MAAADLALAAALLAAGAVGSLLAGGCAAWHLLPQARRRQRRVQRERVRIYPRRPRGAAGLAATALASWMAFQAVGHWLGAWLLAAAVAGAVWLVPGWWREWQESRRWEAVTDQLDQVVSRVATSLRRGTPLAEALAQAARATPPPLGTVLQTAGHMMNLGVPLSQALAQVRSLPEVAGVPDFQVFATQVVICHDRGANVLRAFETLRQVLQARRRYRHQVAQSLGQHLVQALVIVAVGAGVLASFATLTPQGLGPLLQSPVGQGVLAVAVLGNVALVRWTHLSMVRQVRRL